MDGKGKCDQLNLADVTKNKKYVRRMPVPSYYGPRSVKPVQMELERLWRKGFCETDEF